MCYNHKVFATSVVVKGDVQTIVMFLCCWPTRIKFVSVGAGPGHTTETKWILTESYMKKGFVRFYSLP